MKKSKKIFLIVGISLVLAVVIAYVVLYFLFPVETKDYTQQAWAKINEPLPVCGFSIAFIAFFLFKMIAKSSFGKKKYNQLKAEHEKLKEQQEKDKAEFEAYKKAIEDKLEEANETIEFVGSKIKEVCAASPNLNVKRIGECWYEEREETTNDQTTTN